MTKFQTAGRTVAVDRPAHRGSETTTQIRTYRHAGGSRTGRQRCGVGRVTGPGPSGIGE